MIDRCDSCNRICCHVSIGSVVKGLCCVCTYTSSACGCAPRAHCSFSFASLPVWSWRFNLASSRIIASLPVSLIYCRGLMGKSCQCLSRYSQYYNYPASNFVYFNHYIYIVLRNLLFVLSRKMAKLWQIQVNYIFSNHCLFFSLQKKNSNSFSNYSIMFNIKN